MCFSLLFYFLNMIVPDLDLASQFIMDPDRTCQVISDPDPDPHLDPDTDTGNSDTDADPQHCCQGYINLLEFSWR